MFSNENVTNQANYFEEWVDTIGESLDKKLQDKSSVFNKPSQTFATSTTSQTFPAYRWYKQEDGMVVYWFPADMH